MIAEKSINGKVPHVCVIGAGPSGLATAKNLKQRDISFECLEKEQDLGGVWNPKTDHGRVHVTTNMISSKRLTEFVDFRMPREYAHYPRHDEALAYLRSFADHFDLRPHIQFEAPVKRVERCAEGWRVHSNGAAKTFTHLIVANGHHQREIMPNLDGEFAGELIHSSAYKSWHQLVDKRVLVIGAGNSGCDIAVDAAQHAKSAAISIRRGYHVFPKFLFGAPLDRCGDSLDRWRLPRWLNRWITQACLRVAVGSLERYGLPKPDHRVYECHPIVNSQFLHFLQHRRITVRPTINRIEGHSILFEDDARDEFDLVICATGYAIDFPFLERSILSWDGDRPQLFMNVFHPEDDTFFVAGLIQPNGGIWQLADYQSRLIAEFIIAAERGGAAAEQFRNRKRTGDAGRFKPRFISTSRHAVEVDYYQYKRQLKKLLADFV